jgi:hypothetical protein
MRTAEILCAGLLMAVGGLACNEARRLGILGWGSGGPQPGLYPFLLGAGLVLASLVILGRALLPPPPGDVPRPFVPAGAWKSVLSVALPAAAMVLATEFIGLYLAAGLYLAVYMRWIGKHRWRTVAAVSLLLPVAGYVVFQQWFQIPMPEGSLAAYLPF